MHAVKKTSKRRPHLKIWQKTKKSDVLNQEISDLLSRRSSLNEIDNPEIDTFSLFPLSKPTLKGLQAASFIKPTAVQKKSLKHSLAGKDIIVEAKTGSGKTLAFVIPILEYIFTEKITAFDGPIAIILTPTRELAKQIFTVFYRVGKFHNFTMLDIMGGKTRTGKRDEWEKAAKANILIGTPGRFAQHQQQNPTLDMSNLHFLVLDEVDRLLDPTFRHELLIIADNLTTDRQCLLFSATASKSHSQISSLGLKSPVMISTESENACATPAQLIQFYSVVPLEKKLDYLWAFLQSHCKKKIMVFFSTQKQVRFVHDLFLRLRPFFTLMQLRGNMLQSKRFLIYEKFSRIPRGAVLFATNVAERGLDFPEVNWVVQFDCPKQLNDYIHRVGRTARAERLGRAITFLLPSEVKIVELLAKRNVHLRQQQFPESRIQPVVTNRAPGILSSQEELMTSARAAFTAYLRDYCFVPRGTRAEASDMSTVFQPSCLDVDKFAASFGLSETPELPKTMLQYRLTQGIGANSTRQLTGDTKEVLKHGKRWQKEDSDPVQLKAFSILRPEVKAKAAASGCKLLEVISSDDEEEKDEELKNEDKLLTKTKTGALSFRLDTYTNTADLLPRPALDIATEQARLHTIVDVEDKARWRTQIHEKHRLERKKAKEARKLEKAETAPLLLDNEADDGSENSESDEEDADGSDESEVEEEDDEDVDVDYAESVESGDEEYEEEKVENPARKRRRKC